MNYDTDFTKECVCPYCGAEQSDSWELEDNGEYYCDVCENEYDYTRHTEITYCTYKKGVSE